MKTEGFAHLARTCWNLRYVATGCVSLLRLSGRGSLEPSLRLRLACERVCFSVHHSTCTHTLYSHPLLRRVAIMSSPSIDRFLSLRRNSQVTSEGLITLLKVSKYLHVLDIGRCEVVSHPSPVSAFFPLWHRQQRRVGVLMEVTGSTCGDERVASYGAFPPQLTDEVLLTLSQFNLQLRSLSISKNEVMTDAGMVPLVKSCTQLHRLKMDEVHGVTAAVVLAISLNCHGMQMLDVTGCDNIPETSIHAAAGVRVTCLQFVV